MSTLDLLVNDSKEKMYSMYSEDVVAKMLNVLNFIGPIECKLELYSNSSKMTHIIRDRCKDPSVFDYNIKNYHGMYALGDRFRNYVYVGMVTTHAVIEGEYIVDKIVYVYGSDKRLGVTQRAT